MSSFVAIAASAMAFVVVAGIFFVISRVVRRSEEAIDDRLDQFVARDMAASEDASAMAKSRSPSAFSRAISEAAAEKSFARTVSTKLARANLKLTVGEYIILAITSVLGTGLVFYIIMHQNLILTFGGLVLGYFLPGIYISSRQRKRLKQFNGQLGDAINLLANGLRSGYSLLQAMDAVAREMPAPISEEFQRVVQEIGLGLSNERAMENMLRRVPSDDLDLMLTAINVQHEVGGNLAEILETISHTIRERIRIKGEIMTLTAQGQISGYVVSFLPVALGLILFAMNPEYMGRMFTDVCGIAMLSIGVIMIVIGFFAIKKIMNIEV